MNQSSAAHGEASTHVIEVPAEDEPPANTDSPATDDVVTLPAQVTMLPQFPPGQKPPVNIESQITTGLLQKVSQF